MSTRMFLVLQAYYIIACTGKKIKFAYEPIVGHHAGAYPSFPLNGMLVHRRVTPGIKFAATQLYTWVERGTVRVKCLAQPRSQGLSSLSPLVVGRKTLVAAGHMTTQNLGGKKICWVGGVAEYFVWLM